MWELGVGVLISGLIYFGSDKLPKQILYREKREELIKKLTTNASDRTQILTKYKDMFTDEEIEQFTTDEDRLSDNDSNQSDTYKIDTANLPIRLATTKRHANLEIGNKNIDLDKVIVKGNVNNAEVTKVEVKESKIAYKTYLGNWEYETNIATVYSK